MTSLSFTKFLDNYYESDEIQLEKDSVIELNFNSVPDFLGVTIKIFQSLTKTGWTMVYSEDMRNNTTWCKTLAGVSENAYYKVVTTVNPSSASYE